MIKNLNIKEKGKKIFNSTKKVMLAGSATGAGIAAVVNEWFPNLVPSVGSYLIAKNPNIGFADGLALSVTLSSLQADAVMPVLVTATGAGIGMLLTGGYTLVKHGIESKKKREENLSLGK